VGANGRNARGTLRGQCTPGITSAWISPKTESLQVPDRPDKKNRRQTLRKEECSGLMPICMIDDPRERTKRNLGFGKTQTGTRKLVGYISDEGN
jgi:hypothetical protein